MILKNYKPGPGEYKLAPSFNPTPKPVKHQFFGSASIRFQESLFAQSFGAKNQQIGPGSYEHIEDISKE